MRLPIYGEMRSRWDRGHVIAYAIVDDADGGRLLRIGRLTLWNGYPSVWIDGKRWYLHHFIIGKPRRGQEVDHKDRNKLDNRRDNLRFVTKKHNRHNQGGWRNSSSQFRGVSWNQKMKRWQAYVCPGGRKISLGYFDDEVAAAEAAKIGRQQHLEGALA